MSDYQRKITEILDNVQQSPDDSGGPWTRQEVDIVMTGKGSHIYLGWSYHDWYVALLEYRLQRLVNK